MSGYAYFVSYASEGHRFGNTEMTMEKPITSMKDVQRIEEVLTRQKDRKILVLNYQLLRKM